jgi:hypothetical protein
MNHTSSSGFPSPNAVKGVEAPASARQGAKGGKNALAPIAKAAGKGP